METNFPLRILVFTFLVAMVAGCGDQISDPIVQEEDYGSLEGIPIAFMSAVGTESSEGPYPNFRFKVEIDGILQAGFLEVIMPDARVNLPGTEPGGETTGQTEYSNLILMWGVTSNIELYNWFGEASDGNVMLKNLSVILMDEDGSDAARWNFVDASPIRYDAPDLDAMGSAVAIEALEISFESMVREY